jgi:hypothetical protein
MALRLILYGLGAGERVESVPQLGLGIGGLLALAVGLAVLGWRTVDRRGGMRLTPR